MAKWTCTEGSTTERRKTVLGKEDVCGGDASFQWVGGESFSEEPKSFSDF